VLVFFVDQVTPLAIPYAPLTVRQLLLSLLVVSVGIYAYQQSREALVRKSVASEEISREEKIKAGLVIEKIDEGIVAVNEAGQVLLMNEAAEDLLNRQRSDLLGKRFVDAV